MMAKDNYKPCYIENEDISEYKTIKIEIHVYTEQL